MKRLSIIGVPSSAGAYAPGQEKAPDALRASGLIRFLEDQHVTVNDKGNVPGFRWTVDRQNPRAMNVNAVAEVSRAVAHKVNQCVANNEKVVVLGGDCSIELGVVAGCLQKSESLGLIYIDLDTDLNTPHSVQDGALDWMGVAHLLNIEGSETELTSLGKRTPMLFPNQIHFYGNGNMESFEEDIIRRHQIREIRVDKVAADPVGTSRSVRETWTSQFEHILIHLDVDILDFVDFQLAENCRRNVGLKLQELMCALEEFFKIPNWSVLTITEINPDHGEADGTTLRTFSLRLAQILAASL
jgi:arginase